MSALAALGLALLLSSSGRAQQYTGIPTEGVEGFGVPMFQTTETGWSAQVEDGIVRVYVGADAEAAEAWVELMRSRLVKQDPQPYPPEDASPEALAAWTLEVDAALGEPESLLLLRRGNLGVMVHTAARAQHWAEVALAAASQEPQPWPAPPTLSQDDLGWWRLTAPGAVHIAYVGGERVPGSSGLVFEAPPRAAVAWDRFGRAARIGYAPDGTPVLDPPQ